MHRSTALLPFALLLSASFLHAQDISTNSPPPLPAEGHSTVSGHIFCADTNKPARNAHVRIIHIPDSSSQKHAFDFNTGATSDIDGAFTIQGVVAGSYFVQVNTPGYIDPYNSSSIQPRQIQDPSLLAQLRSVIPNVTVNGEDSASIDIRLERGGSISGTILYDDGSPATSISVHLEPTERNKGRFISPNMNGFQGSDDNGHFRLSGISSGDYYIVAQFITFRPAISTINTPHGPRVVHTESNSSTPIYAPGKLIPSEATPIHIAAGDEQKDVSITIPLHGTHTVRGSVILQSSGKPVEQGWVSLTSDHDRNFQRTSTISEDGSIQFDMTPSGTYTMRVDSAFERRQYSQPVMVKGQPEAHVTPMPPPHRYGTTSISITVGNSDVDNVILQVSDQPDPKQTRPGAITGGVSPVY